MDMNAHEIIKIIGNNRRFISPFSKPYGYYIWGMENEYIGNIEIQLYYKKLKYMTENIEMLLQQAFHPAFYQFYGVSRNLTSLDDMYQQLVVESFVLIANDKSVECCLSNSQIMYGHYIICLWSDTWEFIYSDIC